MKLDSYDKKILALLQRDNKMPQRELAELVNLSLSAIHRRVAYLEEAGVIKSNIAVLDPIKVGCAITLIVEVKIKEEQLQNIEHHKKQFLMTPEIQQIYYVTGEFDFLLIMNLENMVQYEKLLHELFFLDENILRFRTSVVTQNIKQTLEVVIK